MIKLLRYIVTTDEINTATGEIKLFLLKNPSTSKHLFVEKILISSQDAGQKTFKIYRNPTITTNGTALTINKVRATQSASIATAFLSPTISANGTLLFGGNFGEGSPLQLLDIPFVVEPSEDILITTQSTSDRIFLTIVWIEE